MNLSYHRFQFSIVGVDDYEVCDTPYFGVSTLIYFFASLKILKSSIEFFCRLKSSKYMNLTFLQTKKAKKILQVTRAQNMNLIFLQS